MSRSGIHPARPTHRARFGWIVPLLCLVLPAGADWLITLEGTMIETAGPWSIENDTLTYVDLEGEEHTLDVDAVDLEGSEETTVLRGGKPRARQEAPSETADETQRRATGEGKRHEPKVILYLTSLCEECIRVQELLERLGVDFVAKDINTSPMARKEYKKKAGHGGGLPVVDIDGALVFSGNPRVIRQRVREMREREAKAEDEAPAPTGKSAPDS